MWWTNFALAFMVAVACTASMGQEPAASDRAERGAPDASQLPKPALLEEPLVTDVPNAGPQTGPAAGETVGPQAATADVEQLKKLIARQLDVIDAKHLMQKMARARAVLGLEGQTLLKNRATLRREHGRAVSFLQRMEGDPLVRDAEALFANRGFREQLLRALELPTEDEQLTAVSEILRENQVDVRTLKRLAHARQVREYVAVYEAGLLGIEKRFEYLQRDFGRRQEDAEMLYPGDLVEMAKMYAGGPEGQLERPSALSGELKGILKALLGEAPASKAAKEPDGPRAGAAPRQETAP